MAHEELVWKIINHQFCSFKVRIDKNRQRQAFCKNEYNVTGLCNRNSCPLANNRYATVREEDGLCYLFLKTVERSHSPKHMWEKIKLSRNYTEALGQISKHTEHWPSFLTHKCKQRLTKIHQYLIRMRKLAMRTAPKLVRVNKKADRRERNRERKALVAANIEKSIQKELLERLRKGTYGDIYNFPEKEYEKALEEADGEYDEMGEDLEAGEGEGEDEDGALEADAYEEDLGDSEDEVEYLEEGEFMESDDEMENTGLSLDEETSAGKRKKSAGKGKANKKSKSGPKIEIEYENEVEDQQALASASTEW